MPVNVPGAIADALRVNIDVDPPGSGSGRARPTESSPPADDPFLPPDLPDDTRFILRVAGILALALAVVSLLVVGILNRGGEPTAAAAPSLGVVPGAAHSANPPTPVSPSTPGANEHRFLAEHGGDPIRWNPCQPIHYVANLRGAPVGAMASVRGAVSRISDATGITFVFDGITSTSAGTQVTSSMRAPSGDWRPLLIAWVDRPFLLKFTDPRHILAVGIPRPGSGRLADEYVSGVVMVNDGLGIPEGFGDRWSLGPVLMHELGHVMGLAHVAAGREIMWSPVVPGATPHPDPTRTTFGPGDLEGLRELGRETGCLPAR